MVVPVVVLIQDMLVVPEKLAVVGTELLAHEEFVDIVALVALTDAVAREGSRGAAGAKCDAILLVGIFAASALDGPVIHALAEEVWKFEER